MIKRKLYLSALPRVFEMALGFNQMLHVIISSVHFSFHRLKTVLYACSKNYFLNVKSGRLLLKVINTYKQDPQCKKIMPCSERTWTMRVCNLNEWYPQHIICVHSGIGQQYHWQISGPRSFWLGEGVGIPRGLVYQIPTPGTDI